MLRSIEVDVEVDAGHPMPQAAPEAQLLPQDGKQLDDADEEGDGHRQRRYDDVRACARAWTAPNRRRNS